MRREGSSGDRRRSVQLGDLVVAGQGPEEERKRALTVVLARRFEPQSDTTAQPAKLLSWEEACAGLTVRGFPVSQHQVKYWIKSTPWGQELWEDFVVTGPQLAADEFRRLPEVVRRLFDLALDPATPTKAMAAVVKAIIAIGDRLKVWDESSNAHAQQANMDLLFGRFAGKTISLYPSDTPE